MTQATQTTLPPLRDKIRNLIHTLRTTDKYKITEKFLKNATHDELVDCVRTILPGYVSSIGTGDGREARHTPPPLVLVQTPIRTTPTRREKVAQESQARQNWREKVMNGWIKAEDGFKLFCDCTAQDFLYAATIRFQHANQEQREAQRLENLAKYLENKYPNGKGKDLSDDEIAKFWERS